MAAINQNDIEKLVQTVTEKAIISDELISFPELKTKARLFLDKIKKASEIKTQEDFISNIQEVKSALNIIYGSMRLENSYTQQILYYQHEFEEELNKYLNRNIYLTYVDDNGNIIAYDDAAIKEIYSKATGNKGRGNITKKVMKELQIDDNIAKINEMIAIENRKRIDVYSTAIQRWENNNPEEVKNYDPSIHTFYWRLHNNYNITAHTDVINTRGVIAEGYAGAVINKAPDVLNETLESSLAALWERYIEKDSIPAAVKGDVVFQEDGRIQFAIKEGSFSTAKVGQYINLAYNITQLSDNTLQSDFKLALPKLLNTSSVANKIIKAINEEAEDKIYQIIKASIGSSKAGSKKFNSVSSYINSL